MRGTVSVGLTVLLLGLSQCSNGHRSFVTDSDGAVTDTPVVGGGDAGDDASDGGIRPIPIRDSGPNGNCSEAAQLVYVLSEDNDLYSFRPNLRMFTRIGRLSCATDMSPNSMAIDRNAVAWVNYVAAGLGDSAGSIFRVNTTDATCQATRAVPLPPSWFRLGMGFSTASADSTDETLFVTGTGDILSGQSPGLARINTTALVPIGPFSGSLRGQSAELTGTGDGRLYGFFTTTPVQVAQIDKTSGAILNAVPLPGVETPQAWAFSFWGGDFYLYTAPSRATGRSSNVTRYRPSDGSIDPAYMTNIGFRIVGAGVSTCAPIAPPG